MGSSLEQVEKCFEFWRFSLVDPSYEGRFRSWLLKEVPQHERKIESFWILRRPVTNAEYCAFLRDFTQPIPESLQLRKPGNHPVWGVTVAEAMAYTDWLGRKLGRSCRLPTEPEWEYAARAGTITSWSIAEDANLQDYAWYDSNNKSPFGTGPKLVKTKLPNP